MAIDVTELQAWAVAELGLAPHACRLVPLSGDASFRKYFRLFAGDRSWILADAPPATEKNPEFVRIAAALAEAGVLAPRVLAADFEVGRLLLSDLGDDLLLPSLNPDSVDHWYGLAMAQIRQMQTVRTDTLPAYDDTLLLQEMNLFSEWFVKRLLGYEWSVSEAARTEDLFEHLLESATSQPQVFVHRDYHSRNIMCTPAGLAAIDFQDAVRGPITYDLISLLRDCYIVWPEARVDAWREQFYLDLVAAGRIEQDLATFERWFDWMGLQRHIKVLGIFARLSLRDHKHGYLNDLPTVIHYTLRVARAYPEFQPWVDWFEQTLLPRARLQPWGKVLDLGA